MFIGYPPDTKGYKLYDVESKKFMRSKDVVFYENKFHDFENITKELIIREDPSEAKLSTNHVQNHDVVITKRT